MPGRSPLSLWPPGLLAVRGSTYPSPLTLTQPSEQSVANVGGSLAHGKTWHDAQRRHGLRARKTAVHQPKSWIPEAAGRARGELGLLPPVCQPVAVGVFPCSARSQLRRVAACNRCAHQAGRPSQVKLRGKSTIRFPDSGEPTTRTIYEWLQDDGTWLPRVVVGFAE